MIDSWDKIKSFAKASRFESKLSDIYRFIDNPKYFQNLKLAVLHARMKKSPDVVFVHVPKTAGTNVRQQLTQSLDMVFLNVLWKYQKVIKSGSVTPEHLYWIALVEAQRISPDFHNRAWKFSIARNPYDRIVSAYNFLLENGKVNQGFDEFLDMASDLSLQEQKNNGPKSKVPTAFLPQHFFITDRFGSVFLDDIFYLEKLSDLDEELHKRFDVNTNISTSVVKASRKEMTKQKLLGNQTQRSKVEKLYERDFEILGYDFAR